MLADGFSTRRGRTKAGYGDKPGDDYIMAAEDVAKVAVLMAALPDEVNLYEATILPNTMKSLKAWALPRSAGL